MTTKCTHRQVIIKFSTPKTFSNQFRCKQCGQFVSMPIGQFDDDQIFFLTHDGKFINSREWAESCEARVKP